MKITIYIYVMLVVFICKTNAQPDAASKQTVNGMVLYQDYKDKTAFYYVPLGLKLITDKGKPQFQFIQMRYTGTQAYADQGDKRFRSLINFSVSQDKPKRSYLDSITTTLQQRGYKVNAIRPIPIHNLSATLVHAANPTNLDSLKHIIAGGHFQNQDNSLQGSEWIERDFTLRLTNEDAQLFSKSLEGNQPTLSVNYSYSSKLVNVKPEAFTVMGDTTFVKTMEALNTEYDSVPRLQEIIIKSDALPIALDLEKWPDLIRKIDINSQIPSDYAALDVYCYDFNNNIRDDLYAKRIDVKAVGVGGSEVINTASFSSKSPEEYAKSIKFIYAVRLSEPYQYRVTEIFMDGAFKKHGWVTAASWHQILDITTQPIEN